MWGGQGPYKDCRVTDDDETNYNLSDINLRAAISCKTLGKFLVKITVTLHKPKRSEM
jgi:hypothetical protein